MRKGELSRERIVETAEKLFWEKGYEETSIQDILDTLGMSKGGFYHHFDSKEQLLGEVTEKRLRQKAEETIATLDSLSVRDALNSLLALTDPFEREEIKYAAMLTRACVLGHDVTLRERQRKVLTESLQEAMEKVIVRGIREDLFSVSHVTSSASFVLLLSQDAVEEAMRLLAAKDDPDRILSAARLLEDARHAVEKLLCAPYGTCRIAELTVLFEHLTKECLA